MRRIAFHALGRDSPKRLLQIDFLPGHFRDFTKALAGQEQQPHKWRGGIADVFGSLPQRTNLCIARAGFRPRNVRSVIRVFIVAPKSQLRC